MMLKNQIEDACKSVEREILNLEKANGKTEECII